MKMTMMNLTTNNYRDNPDFVHVFKVEEHEHYKPLLLQAIKDMVDINDIKPNREGYLYDYNISKVPRTYDKLFYQLLFPYISEMEEIYGLKIDEKQPTPWFQQYFQNSSFGWHQHGGHWAVVYYLELPEMSESTEFLNFDINLQEGDLIFFPTFLVHRSPIIKSDKRKTIIATNLDFSVDRKMIKHYGIEHFRN